MPDPGVQETVLLEQFWNPEVRLKEMRPFLKWGNCSPLPPIKLLQGGGKEEHGLL